MVTGIAVGQANHLYHITTLAIQRRHTSRRKVGIIGMSAWTYQWYRPGGEHTSDQIADFFADLVIHGVSAAPSVAAKPPAKAAKKKR